MAITSTTVFDISGGTQSITLNNPSQIEQISFSSNQITFSAASAYNLSKTDFILYFLYLNVFNNLLFTNFPSIASSTNLSFPVSQFDVSQTSVGVTKILYTQTSLGGNVLLINYVPLASAAAFTVRAAPVTISLQEWFMSIYVLAQYTNQVRAN